MKKPIRIGIAGPSGTGKSTLAQWIEKEYDIPFITTSTKPLWGKYGITSHFELIQKTLINPNWGMDFQNEVLDYRIAALKGQENFVTDRTPLDNFVYFLLQNAQSLGEGETEAYANRCKEAMGTIDCLIWLKFNDETVLQNDGMRIANSYYQHLVEASFETSATILSNNALYKSITMTIPFWDWERRKKVTHNFIQMIRGDKPFPEKEGSAMPEDQGLKIIKDKDNEA